MSYISHEDYKNLMGQFQKQTPKGMLKEDVKEGNAFTAALAKTKKGSKAKVDGKEITDTSNYDDPSVKEYGYADQPPAGTPHHAQYPESWPVRERGDHPGEAERTHIDNIAGRMKDRGMKADDIYDVLVGEYDVDSMVADVVIDDLFGKKEGLNPAPMQATGPTIDTKEGLNPAPMQATGQSIDEDHMEPFKLPKRTDTSRLDYDPDASRFEPDYMKTPGEDDDDEDDIISATDDFEDLDDELPAQFKRAVAGDRSRHPFLREGQAPFGMEALPPGTKQQLQTSGLKRLSPTEREQLQEYIESVKTIKKEIAKLAAKAGKKVKTESGDTTGLTMSPSVTSEVATKDRLEQIESKIPEKLYVASEKVIEHLQKVGLTTGEIKLYLNHEVEEMARKAAEAQHDIAEDSTPQPEEASKKKVLASGLKKGDIMTGTGERVVGVWPGARKMDDRLDMSKVTVELERTRKDGTKTTRVGLWGKNTPVGVYRSSEG